MKTRWISSMAAVAAAIGLSACAPKPEIAKLPSAGDFARTSVYVAGINVDDPEPGKLRETLSRLEGIDLITSDGRAKFKELLERIEQGTAAKEAVPEALLGLGGFYTRLVASTALSSPENMKTFKLSGKIRRYIFNRGTGGGYLEVDTTVETFVNGARVGEDKYLWSIAVRPGFPGSFKVHTKDESNPRDPFPGTVKIPEDKLPGIEERQLDHKLFAHGESILVLAVIKNGSLRPANDPAYISDADSCIDLLFRGYPPLMTLPPQSAYCLGRCEDPAIINTM